MTGRRLRLAAVIVVIGALTIGPATADTGTDQITGNGTTDSEMTVKWSDGLVGADNQTVVTPRDQNSPLKFMYSDFQNLAVTVSQTQNLVHQAIKVSWTGFTTPPDALGAADFLQIMQCYGDANTGPDPEDCEYGSANLLPSGIVNPGIGTRTGNVCVPNAVPSTDNPPGAADGSAPSLGCDTGEPAGADHIQPGSDGTTYSIPFDPVGTDQKIYGPATDFYDQFNTNEVQKASTGQDGTGQVYFQALTGTEAPGLGCGEAETDGQARDCWLVVVPRGQYKANGYKLAQGENTLLGALNDSPLGASNWAQRIQIHLGFDLVRTACPIGSAQERETVGTGLVSHAVFSWQLALNAAADCTVLYGYSETPEPTATTQLSDTSGNSAGLAFTTVPIGSEADRGSDQAAGTGPPVVYAPVTISAITFAFNINLNAAGGDVLTPIKLTPRLVAKALTQSYRSDLVDWTGNNGQPLPESKWADNNPISILTDPEFRKLNPDIPTATGSGSALAPLVTEDHSGVNQQVWDWILADPAARVWLAGTPDENGMVVNPHFKALNPAGPPVIDTYPRADDSCFNTGQIGEKDPGRCAVDVLPYVNDLEDGAVHVRAANNPESPGWNPQALAPDGSAGWWVSNGVEPAGTIFMWTITDTANLANYGLVPADLCDASGAHCVSANTASVGNALAAAKPDSTGLLHVDPAAPGAGGYPLVDVSYAAVRTTQSPAALTDYARLITYAAGAGQTPGVDPGNLPHGYLPLTDSLKAKAMATAATLLADANAKPGSASGGGGGSGSAGGSSGGGSPGSSAAGGGGAGATASGGNPAAAKSGGGTPSAIGRTPELVAQKTPDQSPGAVRWVLFVVLVVGVVGGLSGPLVRNPAFLLDQWRRIRR